MALSNSNATFTFHGKSDCTGQILTEANPFGVFANPPILLVFRPIPRSKCK